MDEATKKQWLDKYHAFLAKYHVLAVSQRILPTLVAKYSSNISLTIDDSGECYTDGKHINLSLLPFFFNERYTMDDWMLAFRAAVAHEAQHINSTPIHYMKDMRSWYGDYMSTKYSFHKSIGTSIGGQFTNIFEDGRIEQIAAERHPGLIVPLQFMNFEMFRDKQIPETFKSGSEEYEYFGSQVLCYTKLGRSVPGFKKLRGTRFHDMFMAIRGNIDKAVNAVTCADCVREVRAALETLAPYFADLLKADSELAKLLEKLAESMPMSGGDSEQETGSGSGSSGGSSVRLPTNGSQGGSSGEDGEEQDGQDSSDGKDDKDGKDGEQGKSSGSGDEKGSEDSSGSGDDKKDGQDGDSSGSQNSEGGSKNAQNSKNKKPSEGRGKADDGDNAPSGTDDYGRSSGGGSSGGKGYGSRNLEELDPKGPPYSVRELAQAMERGHKDVESAKRPTVPKDQQHNELTPDEIKKLQGLYKGDRWTSYKEYYYDPSALPLPSDIAPQASNLHRRLERILRQKNQELRNQRKGTLDCRSLWKVGAKCPDVFMKKGHPVTADCAVFELIDNSGSMGGLKFKMARTVAGALEVALHGLASLKVSLFNVGSGVEHMTIKDFRDTSQNGRSVVYGSLKNSAISAGGGNKDGYSIRVATRELMKRPEKNKVLVVISDGLPSEYSGGYADGMRDVKNAVKEAKKQGIIVIAFLIGDRSFIDSSRSEHATMYGKDLISCEPERMLKAFEKLFTQLIKNT